MPPTHSSTPEAGARPALRATVRHFFEAAVDDAPDVVFLIHGEQCWTYADFDMSCNRVAHGLLSAGVRCGDRLAYQLPHGLALLRLELAAQKIGAITVPLIPGSTAREVAYVIGHATPRFIVTNPADEAAVRAAVALARKDIDTDVTVGSGIEAGDNADCGVDVIVVPEVLGDLGPLEGYDTTRPAEPGTRQPAMSIRYTSGSTGRPKGVVQPATGFAQAGSAIAARLAMTPADRMFCAMPLFHTAATHMMLAPAIAARCPFVLAPRFSRSSFWHEVRSSGATLALLMPTQLSILMTAPPSDDDADNPMRVMFSHVRNEEFCRRFGIDICTTWAMTETSGMGTLQTPGAPEHPPKIIGGPVPDTAEIRIVAPDGTPVEAGELGELCFRHPDVMIEYHRDPMNTSSTLRDGWVHSGDLCSMDAAGNAYFHGRIKNVIKRGGENIAGEEVEFTIMDHPGVEECLVTAVEDEIYTEEVCAVVVLRQGQDLLHDDIVGWCSDRLSTWKVPRYLDVRTQPLPKLANGKTDRSSVAREVREAAHRLWDRKAGA